MVEMNGIQQAFGIDNRGAKVESSGARGAVVCPFGNDMYTVCVKWWVLSWGGVQNLSVSLRRDMWLRNEQRRTSSYVRVVPLEEVIERKSDKRTPERETSGRQETGVWLYFLSNRPPPRTAFTAAKFHNEELGTAVVKTVMNHPTPLPPSWRDRRTEECLSFRGSAPREG